MNTHTVTLSSNSTSNVETLNTITLSDYTKITIDLEDIYSKTIPIFITIDWGDGVMETHDNDLYLQLSREDINIFNPSPLLTNNYVHEYPPSETDLFIIYHIQVLIYYSTLEHSTYTIPIKIRTNDYFESIYDLSLLHINILPESNNPKEFQFKTTIDNHLIELRDDY